MSINLTEKELSLFNKSCKDHSDKKIAEELYLMVKKNKLKRALNVGTGDWLIPLSMALGGAWVVSLNSKSTSPSWFGILNSYQDKVFEVLEKPVNYLSSRENKWDIVVLNKKNYLNSEEDEAQLIMRTGVYYVVVGENGMRVETL